MNTTTSYVNEFVDGVKNLFFNARDLPEMIGVVNTVVDSIEVEIKNIRISPAYINKIVPLNPEYKCSICKEVLDPGFTYMEEYYVTLGPKTPTSRFCRRCAPLFLEEIINQYTENIKSGLLQLR